MNVNTRYIAKRVVADLLLMTGAFFLPWWVVLLCASVLFFVFDRFFELFFLAFLMDLLYAVPLARFGQFEFVLSLASVPLYGILVFIKKRMRI